MILYKRLRTPVVVPEYDVKCAVQEVWREIASWLKPNEVATVTWSVMSTPYVDIDTEEATTQHTSVMAEVKGV